MYLVLAVLAFCTLILVHEFGHFITAKRGGIQVNEFWIGMGPTLFKKEHNGTVYCLKALPFGGACVMEGEDEESESTHAFSKAPLPRRILVVAAGALMNFVTGFVIVLLSMQPNGPEGGYILSTVESLAPTSAAAQAGGLQAGDEILKVDGYSILVRGDFEMALSRTTSPLHQIVVRRQGKRVTLPEVDLTARVPAEDGKMLIGIAFAEQPATIGTRLAMSVRTSVNYARLVWVSLGQLIGGQVGLNQMSGPVGVATVMADTAKYSLRAFLQLVAFISINLGVMNLLPLPALDGGRLVFLLLEGIRRKPLPAKYEGYIHAAGMALLLALMVYITGHDIFSLAKGFTGAG